MKAAITVRQCDRTTTIAATTTVRTHAQRMSVYGNIGRGRGSRNEVGCMLLNTV